VAATVRWGSGLHVAVPMAKRGGLSYSKSEIDRIGDRLRDEQVESEILVKLDAYRESFEPAYQEVVSRIREELKIAPTGRPGKSIPSILHKLNRESIRLSQMQDIAGCRIVVVDIPDQDEVLRLLGRLFGDARTIDRRIRPSHGYRAVHVVARIAGLPVEIQVRTDLQHLWAEYSEMMADAVDKDVKYGEGPVELRELLASAARLVQDLESIPATAELAWREERRLDVINMFQKLIRDGEKLRR